MLRKRAWSVALCGQSEGPPNVGKLAQRDRCGVKWRDITRCTVP